MKLNLSTAAIARTSARHPWRAISAWLTMLGIAIALISTLLGSALTTEATGTLTNNPESMQADNLLSERLGDNSTGEIVVVRSTTLTVDDPAYRAYVEQLYGELTALDDQIVAGGTHYYLTGDESLVSADRLITLIPLVIPDGVTSEIDQVHQIVQSASAGGAFQVLVTGQATLDAEVKEVAENDLAKGEGIGITVALVVLTLVIGAIAAASGHRPWATAIPPPHNRRGI